MCRSGSRSRFDWFHAPLGERFKPYLIPSSMESNLRELLLRQGMDEATVHTLEKTPDAPVSEVDLALGASSEDDARSWAQELGLTSRISVSKFVRAWMKAREIQQLDMIDKIQSGASTSEFPPNTTISEMATEGELETSLSSGITEHSSKNMTTPNGSKSHSKTWDTKLTEILEELNQSEPLKVAHAGHARIEACGISASSGSSRPCNFFPFPRKGHARIESCDTSASSGSSTDGAEQSQTGSMKQSLVRQMKHSPSSPAVLSSPNIRGLVAACPLFSKLKSEDFDCILRKVVLQNQMAVGHRIFGVGQSAEEMFFVMTGEVGIQDRSGKILASIPAGGFFGEIGVLFAGVRSADAVVSRGPCQLAQLGRSDLQFIAQSRGFVGQLAADGQDLRAVRTWFAARLPLFAHCLEDSKFFDAVAEALEIKTGRDGEVMVKEGDDGNEMFFIFEGAVHIMKNGSRKGPIRISAPSHFGELALLYSEPRSATVKCNGSCRFYTLDRIALHGIMQEFPSVIGKVYSSAQEASNLKLHFIKKIPLFKSMAHNEEFLANMQLALESASAAPGEFILREGEKSDGKMFAIAHGHAEIRKTKTAGEPAQRVGTLSAGSIFGEVALLLDTPRTASVVAVGHCHVYTLSRDAFETLAVVYDGWWRELTSERGVLLKQLQSTGVKVQCSATTHTHGLQLPQVEGVTVSTMLSAASAPSSSSAIPNEKLCVVCRNNVKCMLSMPCGHIAVCEDCHGHLKNCPMCRMSIEKGIKAFF